MSLIRGLAPRILALAFVAGLLISLLTAVTTQWRNVEIALERSSRHFAASFDEEQRAACQANPAAWVLQISPEVRIDAFDAETGLSSNPAAEPVPATLAAELRAGTEHARHIESMGAVTLGLRVAPEGPCSALAVRMRYDDIGEQMESLLLLTAGMFGVGLVLLFGMGLLAVRPLTRRIRRIHLAAARVGERDGYRSAADALPDELGELSTMLDQAHARIRGDAQKLEDGHRALREHLIRVAHDLKTPIASLQLSLENVHEQLRDEAARSLVGQALGDTVYLASLTDNLRLKTQLEQALLDDVPLSPLDLREIVARVAARAKVIGELRQLHVVAALPDRPVWVSAESLLLEQAIGNVAYNAVSHNHDGGNVALALDVDDEAFRLVVMDDGPGVAEEDLAHLTEWGYRAAEARQRDSRGTGLGLAIARDIFSRHGFSLRFAHASPHGLRVEIAGGLCGAPS